MPREHRRGSAVGALLLALVGGSALAGCTDEAKPSPLPSTSSSPTASTSATPAAPVLPAAAQGRSPRAAEAFARHYVDVINYAMHSGQLDSLQRLSAKSCATCNVITDEIRSVYAKGGHLEGDGWVVTAAIPAVGSNAASAQVALSVRISSQRKFSDATSSPTNSTESKGKIDLSLSRSSNSWLVERLDASQ